MDKGFIKIYGDIESIMYDIEKRFLDIVNKIYPVNILYGYDLDAIRYNISQIVKQELCIDKYNNVYNGYIDGYSNTKSSTFTDRDIFGMYTITAYSNISDVGMIIRINVCDGLIYLNRIHLCNLINEYSVDGIDVF